MEVLRARLCEWSPLGVEAMAFAPAKTSDDAHVPQPRLAVGRAEGVIELWDTRTWHLHSSTAGHKKRSVRALAWRVTSVDGGATEKRLFSAGLHSEITEWNSKTLQQVTSVTSGGGPVWALEESAGNLFAACEDGSVRLFELGSDAGEVTVKGRFQVGKLRVLSMTPFGSDFFFAGGSESRISKWSMKSRSCESSVTVEKASGSETLVWALATLGDDSVASGDSLGHVHIWDANMCILMHRFSHHQADVLCLAASSDGSFLVSSGVDARVCFYAKDTSADGRWLYNNSDLNHTHDVRALAIEDETHELVSGGVSGALQVNERSFAMRCVQEAAPGKSRKGFRVIKLSNFSPLLNSACVAQASRLMLCQNGTNLELWYMQPPKQQEGGGAPPVPEAQHVLRVSLTGAKEGRHIACSSIAPDGSRFAASDDECTRLFDADLEELQVRRSRTVPAEVLNTSARALLFCSNAMLAVAPRGSPGVLMLDVPQAKVAARLGTDGAPVALLASGGEWLAAADLDGAVQVYSLDRLQRQGRVPIGADDKIGRLPTALGLDCGRNRLFVALSDHTLVIYDIEAKCLLQDMPNSVLIPTQIVPKFARICGVSVPSGGQGNKLLLWGHNFLAKAEIRAPTDGSTAAEGPPQKKRKGAGDDEATNDGQGTNANCMGTDNCHFRSYDGMQHIMGLVPLDEAQWGEPLLESSGPHADGPPVAMALTLEVSPEAVQKSLPQPFERKKYQQRSN